MGTKWTKNSEIRYTWGAGKKRKRGHITANGMNATKYLQQSGQERPRHSCEVCGAVQSTWRANAVCLCDKCWTDLWALIRR